MDCLSVEDRAKLEAKIMEAITDVLEHADESEQTSSGSMYITRIYKDKLSF